MTKPMTYDEATGPIEVLPSKTVRVPVLRPLPLKMHAEHEPMYWDEASQAFWYPGEKPVFDQVELVGASYAVDLVLASLAKP